MDFLNSLLLLSICLVSLLFVRAIFTITNKKHLPPSPPALPVIGHLHLLGRIPHQALHKLSCRYGPVIYLFFGSKPCVVISSPEMAIQFLKNHESSFLNRPTRINVNYLTYGSSDFTFAPYGSYWKFLKKLCMTELLGGRTLDLHRPVRQKEMSVFIEKIHRRAVVGVEIDVGDELLKLMNNMISMMILRRRCLENEDVSKLVKEMSELSGKLNISDMIWFCKNLDLQGFGKRVKDVRNRYDILMEKIMKEHEEARMWKKEIGGEEEVKDLLDILLDIYEDKSTAVKLTRENIKAFVMNLFGAGTDTSAVTIEWALSELINNPNLMEKARKEIDALTQKRRIVEETDIPNLPYLQAIVKETLRLHPTGPLIVRQATEDCNVNGYHIPDKSRLLVNVWAIGRDPKNWENPLEFKPERFLNVKGKKNNFESLSFGSGRRSCPGASLALQVIPTVIGAMIQCFEWKVDGYVLDMEEAPGISLPRAHPLVSIPLPRLNPFPFPFLC